MLSLPSRRRSRLASVASLTLLTFVTYTSYNIFASVEDRQRTTAPVVHTPPAPVNVSVLPVVDDPVPLTPHSPYVLGLPTARFRDNLRNDTKYITSWISAGWTNDILTYANLIYVGVITDRIPIIPMFTPSHIGGDADPIPFGDIFDVPRFIRDSGIGMVEWRDVKDPKSEAVEDLGCWNIWEAVQYYEHFPRNSAVPDWLKLDISYTKAPGWVKLIPDYEHDKCSTYWALARLSFPEERAKNLVDPLPSRIHGAKLPPDDHLLCYDYLYYACAQQSAEVEFDYAPVWRYVMQHFRWNSKVERIAARYLRDVFELSQDAQIPFYVAVHVRHGDFAGWCWRAEKPEDCFAPIPVIARRVREVIEELRVKKGAFIPFERVIITSDETDPAWWDQIRALGWRTVNHTEARTALKYGRWWPVILDAAIQSGALGFVGTDRSTYSIVSRRRVETWHGGATRMVLWGHKGADDH